MGPYAFFIFIGVVCGCGAWLRLDALKTIDAKDEDK